MQAHIAHCTVVLPGALILCVKMLNIDLRHSPIICQFTSFSLYIVFFNKTNLLTITSPRIIFSVQFTRLKKAIATSTKILIMLIMNTIVT